MLTFVFAVVIFHFCISFCHSFRSVRMLPHSFFCDYISVRTVLGQVFQVSSIAYHSEWIENSRMLTRTSDPEHAAPRTSRKPGYLMCRRVDSSGGTPVEKLLQETRPPFGHAGEVKHGDFREIVFHAALNFLFRRCLCVAPFAWFACSHRMSETCKTSTPRFIDKNFVVCFQLFPGNHILILLSHLYPQEL